MKIWPQSLQRRTLGCCLLLTLLCVGCSQKVVYVEEPEVAAEPVEIEPLASSEEEITGGAMVPEAVLWTPTDGERVRLGTSETGIEGQDTEVVELTDEFFQPYNPGKYRISVGDELEISVFGYRDTLSEATPVAPDGKIYYYFVDGIQAEGRTVDEVKDDLEERLGHLFAIPEVSIIPKKVTSARYVVLGKVKYPGTYYIDSALTVRQAIGSAGGLEDGGYKGTSIQVASLDKSFMVRDGKRLPVDFDSLLNSQDSSSDIYMRPGDYIYVASSLIQEVYRIGAVKEQRPLPYQDGMTLVGLITGHGGETGGYLPQAYLEEVIILRGALDDPEVQVVDLLAILEGRANDVYLAPGDVVYVPYRRYKWVRDLVKTALFAFTRSFTGRAGWHYADKEWFPE